MDETCFLHCSVNDIKCTFHKTFLVCILYTKEEISPFMLCDQIRV